jgi:hypothetical protein
MNAGEEPSQIKLRENASHQIVYQVRSSKTMEVAKDVSLVSD